MAYSRLSIALGKTCRVLLDPFSGGFGTGEHAPFVAFDFLAVILDRAHLLDHARTERRLGVEKLDANQESAVFRPTPDHPTLAFEGRINRGDAQKDGSAKLETRVALER